MEPAGCRVAGGGRWGSLLMWGAQQSEPPEKGAAGSTQLLIALNKANFIKSASTSSLPSPIQRLLLGVML